MGERRWVEDMSGSESFCVVGVCADWRQRAPIQDTFNLDDDGVEGVNVEDVSSHCADEVFLEETHHSLPHSTEMRSSCYNKRPF